MDPVVVVDPHTTEAKMAEMSMEPRQSQATFLFLMASNLAAIFLRRTKKLIPTFR